MSPAVECRCGQDFESFRPKGHHQHIAECPENTTRGHDAYYGDARAYRESQARQKARKVTTYFRDKVEASDWVALSASISQDLRDLGIEESPRTQGQYRAMQNMQEISGDAGGSIRGGRLDDMIDHVPAHLRVHAGVWEPSGFTSFTFALFMIGVLPLLFSAFHFNAVLSQLVHNILPFFVIEYLPISFFSCLFKSGQMQPVFLRAIFLCHHIVLMIAVMPRFVRLLRQDLATIIQGDLMGWFLVVVGPYAVPAIFVAFVVYFQNLYWCFVVPTSLVVIYRCRSSGIVLNSLQISAFWLAVEIIGWRETVALFCHVVSTCYAMVCFFTLAVIGHNQQNRHWTVIPLALIWSVLVHTQAQYYGAYPVVDTPLDDPVWWVQWWLWWCGFRNFLCVKFFGWVSLLFPLFMVTPWSNLLFDGDVADRRERRLRFYSLVTVGSWSCCNMDTHDAPGCTVGLH
jgi:hypothetical protein